MMLGLNKGNATDDTKEKGIVLSQMGVAESKKDDLVISSGDKESDTNLNHKEEIKSDPVSEFFLSGSGTDEETSS